MNPMTIMTEFFCHIRLYRSMRSVYRGSIISTADWKNERALTAVLCAGAGLMIIAANFNIRTIFFGTEVQAREPLSKNIQSPSLLTATIPTQEPLPEASFKGKRTHSLFKLAKHVAFEPPNRVQHVGLEKPAHKAEIPAHDSRFWQLQIQHSTVSEALMRGAMTDADKYLYSGHVDLARQAYMSVLTQDAHNVEALEGMLVVARRLKDIQNEEVYLERLRLEIPDYDDGNVQGSHVPSVSPQD